MKTFIRRLPACAIALLMFAATAHAQPIVITPAAPAATETNPAANSSSGDDATTTRTIPGSLDTNVPPMQRAGQLLGNGFRQPVGMPNMNDSGIYSCTDSTECVIVTPPCNAPIAVNRSAQQNLQGWYDSQRSQMNCTNTAGSNMAAICSGAHTCIIARPGQNGVPRRDNPGYCDTNEDCTVVADACGRKKAVNAGTAGNQAPAADGSSANCSYTDQTKVKSMQCKNHLCTATFTNN
ncbi:MAG: hypothetical protein PW788_03475 [Micavibrio sp.]|nr:hypothetical protein [Micavibrio sp.]